MIKAMLGKPGSGKTATAVYEILQNNDWRHTYTNIEMKKKQKNVYVLRPEYLIRKTLTGTKQKRDGTTEESFDFEPNMQFWKDTTAKLGIVDIVLDEVQVIYDSRSSMSKLNKSMNYVMSMIRRVLGARDSAEGNLIVISQELGSIDVRLRQKIHLIQHHRLHYKKECSVCGRRWSEHSDMAIRRDRCRCGSPNLRKYKFLMEVYQFSNQIDYIRFLDGEEGWHIRHYAIDDIDKKVFDIYNSWQWSNMFEDYL